MNPLNNHPSIAHLPDQIRDLLIEQAEEEAAYTGANGLTDYDLRLIREVVATGDGLRLTHSEAVALLALLPNPLRAS